MISQTRLLLRSAPVIPRNSGNAGGLIIPFEQNANNNYEQRRHIGILPHSRSSSSQQFLILSISMNDLYTHLYGLVPVVQTCGKNSTNSPVLPESAPVIPMNFAFHE
jgi:hypothetical protein